MANIDESVAKYGDKTKNEKRNVIAKEKEKIFLKIVNESCDPFTLEWLRPSLL